MNGFLADLEPARVWRHFERLLSIPRPSGSEEAVADYIESIALRAGLGFHRDNAHNLCVIRPGRGEPVILQAHTDMVAEKLPDSPEDPSKDPIRAVLRNGWVMSETTTLGADNGMGVAIMLALLEDPSRKLPPLECLFTVDEERGLVGAREFPVSWLTGRRMINLDSSSGNTIFIGCAGGRDIVVEMPLERESEVCPATTLRIGGLAGGHSGIEIDTGKANAIRLAARVCRELNLRIVGLDGGTKHNAIPRDSMVTGAGGVSPDALRSLLEDVRQEYSGFEEGIRFSLEPADPRPALTEACSVRLTDLLLALPHGVESFSGKLQGLVQTSCNLAIVETDETRSKLTISVRSSLDASRDALTERILATARLAGCVSRAGEGYPGWDPDPDSPLLAAAKGTCRSVYGDEPRVMAVHAGLECGLIGRRMGGLDMISIGPVIRDIHIPGERVCVESVRIFTEMLTSLLESLAT